ncbi:hypothetical protein Vretimale_14294 [Volvox reticuliferus]|uniref:Uncharacterized protein n=1 Tax=Volvox reticuliferus TaxID=1737510 RepID=A0A8J4LUI5_9CHLO|nr:hypothetical protein Vretimale_14294 [Volvox reticuliferus]
MRKDPGSSTQWLYKTFAYGPAATTAATTQGRCSCIGESADAPVKPTTTTTTTTTTFTCKSTESQQAPPSTVLPPIPAEVTRSHVAAIIAELQHRKGKDGASGSQASGAGAAPAAAVGPGGSEVHNGEWGLISLHVSDNLLAGSTGCHEWEASFALAQWVLGHSERFRGRRVLELGCGAGLVAVALHRAGAAWVAATDGSDAAVANCAANLRLNGVRGVQLLQSGAQGQPEQQLSPPGEVAAFRLSWEDPLEAAALNCEIAVASDVLYDPEIVPVFVALLAHLLRPWSGPEGSVPPRPILLTQPQQQEVQHQEVQEAFIATLRRNPATLDLFLRSAEELSLRVESVDWRDSSVAFHHVPALADPQVAQRIVLQRVTRRR